MGNWGHTCVVCNFPLFDNDPVVECKICYNTVCRECIDGDVITVDEVKAWFNVPVVNGGLKITEIHEKAVIMGIDVNGISKRILMKKMIELCDSPSGNCLRCMKKAYPDSEIVKHLLIKTGLSREDVIAEMASRPDQPAPTSEYFSIGY